MTQHLSTQVTRALHKIDQYFGASDEDSERHQGAYSMQELSEAVERLEPFKPSMFERLLEGTENTTTVKERFGSLAVDVEEQITGLEISPLIRRFGTWAVTDYGIECLVSDYSIEMDRAFETDWLAHMR